MEKSLEDRFKELLDEGLDQCAVLEVLGERVQRPDVVGKVQEILKGTDDLEIDSCPLFSETDNGVWVSAWIFIYNEEIHDAIEGDSVPSEAATESEPASKCKCGEPGLPLHPCPYAEEIRGVTNSEYCNCCDSCTHECCMDI